MPPEFQTSMWITIAITVVSLCATGIFTVAILGVVGFVMYRVMKSVGPDRETLRSGMPAQATILQVWQTGTYVNYSPQVGMRLQVQPPYGAAYEAQVTAVIPMVNIPQFQPGVQVPVKISPKDPSKVALDVYGKV